MKKKTKPTPPLFKIETNIELPVRRVRKSTVVDAIKKCLDKLPIGGSFLISRTQESTVRKMIAAGKYKYNVKITNATEGKDYKRVFRLAESADYLRKNKSPKNK